MTITIYKVLGPVVVPWPSIESYKCLPPKYGLVTGVGRMTTVGTFCSDRGILASASSIAFCTLSVYGEKKYIYMCTVPTCGATITACAVLCHGVHDQRPQGCHLSSLQNEGHTSLWKSEWHCLSLSIILQILNEVRRGAGNGCIVSNLWQKWGPYYSAWMCEHIGRCSRVATTEHSNGW